MRKLIRVSVLVLSLALLSTPILANKNDSKIFDETMELVSKNFYDKNLAGLNWKEITARAKANLRGDEKSLVNTTNAVLRQLKASHTAFFSTRHQEYWALKSIFSKKIEGFRLRQIGAWFTQKGSRVFVQNVFANSQAEIAGLKPGDEIISANGDTFHPVKSFQRAKPLKKITLSIKRTPWDKPLNIAVGTRVESFQETFLRATKQSAREYVIKKKRIGYFRLWAGTHDDFKKALEAAAKKLQKTCDSMILDLRDGFGGAGQAYAEPFLGTKETPPLFSKPLVILINKNTRSGKEWLVHILMNSKRGKIVGERTSGSFLMARTFDIEPNYLLYLAVSAPGKGIPNIEGIGVSPDIKVKQPLVYSSGADPQLYKALTTAASL